MKNTINSKKFIKNELYTIFGLIEEERSWRTGWEDHIHMVLLNELMEYFQRMVIYLELNLMRLLAEYQETNKEAALITVLSSSENLENCSPGTMMLINERGEILAGSIGDDLIREKVSEQARICIDRGLSRKVLLSGVNEPLEIFVNAFCHQDHLILVGGGTVTLTIYKFAKVLGYRIIILDNREEMLTKERFPEAYERLFGDILENLRLCKITENTNIVIATHHHEFDERALKAVIASPARYIGVLGNKRRVAGYLKDLEPLNLSEELIGRVHSPIGLDLGGKRTAEIALAVVAEMQAVKYQRSGGFMSRQK